MNIKSLARDWLVSHNHNDQDPNFESDLSSLTELIIEVLDHHVHIDYNDEEEYDENFGDDRPCECGHPYYRHFDPYDGMSPVGCKYCSHYIEGDPDRHRFEEYCPKFKEMVSQCNCGEKYRNDSKHMPDCPISILEMDNNQ